MSALTISDAGLGHRAEPFKAWLARDLRGNRLSYWLIALFGIYTLGLSVVLGDSVLPYLLKYAHRGVRAILMLGCAAVIIVAIKALTQREHDSPLRYVRGSLLTPAHLLTAQKYIFGCAVLTVFMAAFLYNKTAIPDILPFRWDPVFAEWDRMLFLGHDPWTLLHPFLGHPLATVVIDYLYAAWVPLVFAVWIWVQATPVVDTGLRRQYWLATILSWTLIGLVAATALSSAGPCFAADLFPAMSISYAPLNDYLAQVHRDYLLASSLTKDFLWQVYLTGSDEPGGISAMPSMHNAQAVLFACLGYRVNSRLGHLFAAYAVVIFLGSIHLAWHYAVDGIVAMALALIVWRLAGWLGRERHTELVAA